MGKYLRISSYIRKPFLIYDFATAPHFLICEENLIFYFISAPAYVSSRAGKSNRNVVSAGSRFMGSLTGLQIRTQVKKRVLYY
jgi:hypothetical protein